jgi:hypothetical protein
MVETRRTNRGEKGLALTLGLFVSFGSPARALAQTTGDAGASGWNVPDESVPPEAPAEPPAPPPPAEQSAPRRVEPPPSEPRFPVTFSSNVASVHIRGPGIEKPLICLGTCTFRLSDGFYWLDIHGSGRTWTIPVTVTEPERVVIEAPNGGVRGLGIAAIIVGGTVLSVAGFVLYVYGVNCRDGAYYEGSADCRSLLHDLPYWLAAGGVGAVVGAVGIVLFVSNSKPSVEVLPALGSRARRAPGTFVGLGPVEGSTLPGLSLRASF